MRALERKTLTKEDKQKKANTYAKRFSQLEEAYAGQRGSDELAPQSPTRYKTTIGSYMAS